MADLSWTPNSDCVFERAGVSLALASGEWSATLLRSWRLARGSLSSRVAIELELRAP